MDEAKFYGYCLQGDVTSAYDYLCSMPHKSKKYQQLETQYYQRFFGGKPIYQYKTADPWIRKVLLAYYQYYTSVLTGKSVEKAEDYLLQMLLELISEQNIEDLDLLEQKLAEIFAEKGYHFLGGKTSTFRGPFIWKMMNKNDFKVELPHQTQEVTVFFLRDFIMQSWLHFATFGEKYAGGWAKTDGIYYVDEGSKRVNLDNSEFQVSFLKHEAQHLSDYSRFPKLQSKDLEYRAKLVELIYEPNSIRLLKKFYYEAKKDEHFPHPYSSFVLMTKLSKLACGMEEIQPLERWKCTDPTKIQNWASKLYDENTKQLEESGHETEGVI